MLKLVGGYGTFEKVYRLYINEDTNELIDNYGIKHNFFNLKTLLTMVGESFDDGVVKYLIREDKSEWFCECEIKFGKNTELFIITYGQTPEEAFCKCIELMQN